MCVWRRFLGVRMAVVSRWLVPLENSPPLPTPPPSLDGAAPMFRAEIEGKEKALTQRNATLSDGGCPTITQHIYTAY